jgi:hypothetical protein
MHLEPLLKISWLKFHGLISFPLVYASVSFVCVCASFIPCWLLNLCSSLQIRHCDAPALFFFLKIDLTFQGLCACTWMLVFFLLFLRRMLLELWSGLHWIYKSTLDSMDILTIVVLPIHEYEWSFHFFCVSSLILIISVYWYDM